MFRFPIAAVIGLTASLSAAFADTIIYQGTPMFDPLIITGDHGITRGDVPVLPGLAPSVLNDPAFHRLAEMCDTLGMACGPDRVTPLGGIDPAWTPGHRADAEKRLAQMIEDREAYAEALAEHFDTLPVPTLPIVPRLNFGWNTPFGVPHATPRPFNFDELFRPVPRHTVPHMVLPRPGAPRIHDLSGFYSRLNNPAVIPRGMLPRHSFPWRAF
ncbi:hypothetical protein A8B78_06165 [Jannaschia sp. EhC01]|nr:hypothetical protein A8B78_06165 [Jannaschia sp. EhC01]